MESGWSGVSKGVIKKASCEKCVLSDLLADHPTDGEWDCTNDGTSVVCSLDCSNTEHRYFPAKTNENSYLFLVPRMSRNSSASERREKQSSSVPKDAMLLQLSFLNAMWPLWRNIWRVNTPTTCSTKVCFLNCFQNWHWCLKFKPTGIFQNSTQAAKSATIARRTRANAKSRKERSPGMSKSRAISAVHKYSFLFYTLWICLVK